MTALCIFQVCSEDEVSDKTRYPTFARTFPPAGQITKSVISLLKYYNWTKFSIIYGDTESKTYESVAMRLQELAQEHNMSTNHMMSYPEPHLTLITGNPFPNIIQKTYVDTRVYVFLGYLNAVVDMMINMNDRGLLDTGQYVVIYAEFLEHVRNEPTKYFRRTYEKGNDLPNVRGARSLLVVKQSPNVDIEEFHNNVRHYNKMPPLNFTEPLDWQKIISVYASYLYDAVLLYAHALAQVVAEGGSYLDGKTIVSKIFGITYQSIQGYLVKIDENGDAEGNYSVLALQPNTYQGDPLEYLMLPVAHFRLNQNGSLPIYHMHEGVTIRWLNGNPPLDEPLCGYRGQKCIKPESHMKEIVAGIFGGIVLIATITGLLIYRNWRYEQEIAGLLWKIDASAIHCNDSATGRMDKKALTGDNDNDNSTNCDVLENDDIKLDHMFVASLIKDLLQGMLYIHNSDLVFHGNLKSSNCVVNSRWALQVTDHGLLDTRNSSYRKEDHHAYYRNLLWKAPEILRSNGKLKASQLGDVYAFAIILHEIFGRMGPYGSMDIDPEVYAFSVDFSTLRQRCEISIVMVSFGSVRDAQWRWAVKYDPW
ncbi:guanylate cyclase [Elysia marginata]|uniref:guanylate cyclase n=1 Tax=Elysia marginata TaxID=1093978 RepID=A0AAV4H525_9GAST|nr:guanylate cyclase [Elysia marginata]